MTKRERSLRQSRMMKRRWRDGRYRKRMLSRKKFGRPFRSGEISEMNRLRWASDSKYRKKMKRLGGKTLRSLWKRKEFKAKRSKCSSETARRLWAERRGEFIGYIKKTWKDPKRRKRTLDALSAGLTRILKKRVNRPERELYDFLKKNGIRFKKQYRVLTESSFTIADAYLMKTKILVYTDHPHWHKKSWIRDWFLRFEAKELGFRYFVIDQETDFGKQAKALLKEAA